jgi:hypothetical protein
MRYIARQAYASLRSDLDHSPPQDIYRNVRVHSTRGVLGFEDGVKASATQPFAAAPHGKRKSDQRTPRSSREPRVDAAFADASGRRRGAPRARGVKLGACGSSSAGQDSSRP